MNDYETIGRWLCAGKGLRRVGREDLGTLWAYDCLAPRMFYADSIHSLADQMVANYSADLSTYQPDPASIPSTP